MKMRILIVLMQFNDINMKDASWPSQLIAYQTYRRRASKGRCLLAAQKTVIPLKQDILRRNKVPGARRVRKNVQFIVDHVLVEKLIAGDAKYEVPDEEVQNLLDLAFSDPMSEQDESGESMDGSTRSGKSGSKG